MWPETVLDFSVTHRCGSYAQGGNILTLNGMNCRQNEHIIILIRCGNTRKVMIFIFGSAILGKPTIWERR